MRATVRNELEWTEQMDSGPRTHVGRTDYPDSRIRHTPNGIKNPASVHEKRRMGSKGAGATRLAPELH